MSEKPFPYHCNATSNPFMVHRLEIRADEGRVNTEDLQLAGVNQLLEDITKADHKYNSDDSDSMLSQPASDNHSFDFGDEDFTNDDGFSEHFDESDRVADKC